MILVEHLHSLMYNLCKYCMQVLFTLWIDLMYKMLCVEVTRDVPVHNIFSNCTAHSLYNKIHVEYSNVPLSSRNISCNSFSSHTCTWHKHSKWHAESVWYLEIDLGHVTHFLSLGVVESQTLCDCIRLVNSIRGDKQDTLIVCVHLFNNLLKLIKLKKLEF
jgi:hypothetical protein